MISPVLRHNAPLASEWHSTTSNGAVGSCAAASRRPRSNEAPSGTQPAWQLESSSKTKMVHLTSKNVVDVSDEHGGFKVIFQMI